MNIILENITQNREKWLPLRQFKVTSSKIPTICGLNRFESVLELWAKDTGKLPPTEENDDMWLGTAMQPVIQAIVERKYGVTLLDANCLVQHPQYDWALASPDCWEVGKHEYEGITEIKNTNRNMSASWSDDAPIGPKLQLQWQLGVCGLPGGHVAGLVGGSARGLRYYEEEFNVATFDALLEAGANYLELVRKDIPPEAGPGDLRVLNALLGERTGEVVQLEQHPYLAEYLGTNRDYEIAKERADELKEKRDGLKAKLAQLLGTSSMGIMGDYIVSAKRVERKGFVVEPTNYLDVRVKEKK